MQIWHKSYQIHVADKTASFKVYLSNIADKMSGFPIHPADIARFYGRNERMCNQK